MGVGFPPEAGGCAPDVQAARDSTSIANKTRLGILRFILCSLSGSFIIYQKL